VKECAVCVVRVSRSTRINHKRQVRRKAGQAKGEGGGRIKQNAGDQLRTRARRSLVTQHVRYRRVHEKGAVEGRKRGPMKRGRSRIEGGKMV